MISNAAALKCCRAGASPAKLADAWDIRHEFAFGCAGNRKLFYFVTICVADRKPVLANEMAFGAFKTAVAKLKDWTVLAAILMPDHLHAIVSPKKSRSKSWKFVSGIKAVDAPRTWCVLEMAARLFRSSSTIG
jgi:Transposase IS200 like